MSHAEQPDQCATEERDGAHSGQRTCAPPSRGGRKPDGAANDHEEHKQGRIEYAAQETTCPLLSIGTDEQVRETGDKRRRDLLT